MPGGCSSVPSACRGWSRAICCAAASGAGALRMKAPHRSAPPDACRSGAIASHACDGEMVLGCSMFQQISNWCGRCLAFVSVT